MDTTTNTDLPLSDPKHPLHRPETKTTEVPETKKATASTTAKRAAPTTKKATGKATASAKKPAHQPSQIASTEANPSKSIVPPKFKVAYAEHGGTNGDNVALALKALETKNEDGRPTLDWKVMQQVAKANDIDIAAYAHLNAGQKRMNLGNRLRGMIKAGKTVVIGNKRIATIRTPEAKAA